MYVIAATSRNLRSDISKGFFREDLYYARLNVLNISIPPIVERIEDIPYLCIHFIKSSERLNKPDCYGITPEATTLLSSYNWPGNVRELENIIERTVLLSDGERLQVVDDFADLNMLKKAPVHDTSALSMI